MSIGNTKESAEKSKPSDAADALARFREGQNCAQAILSTYGPGLGLDRENAIKAAAAFGSGMGMGETCGAVTGALMVIGLTYTRTKDGGLFSKDRTQDMAQEFLARFRERHGFTMCRDLLGCDVSTPEGLKAAKGKRHFKKRCPSFVRDAAEILEDVLRRG